MAKTEEADTNYDQDGLQRFLNIVDLCKKEGVELLVVKMPILKDNHSYARYNGVAQLCDSLGVNYVDFNLEEHWNAMELDTKKDFQGVMHLNVRGSDKMSAYMGDYMTEHYNLPDHRGDAAYSVWSESIPEARKDAIGWLRNVADNQDKDGLIHATRVSDTETEVTWPVMSYVKDVRVYRELPGSERIQVGNGSDGIYIDRDPQNDLVYTIEYYLEGVDEPCAVQAVTRIIGRSVFKPSAGQNKIGFAKLSGSTGHTVLRLMEDGTWKTVASEEKLLDANKFYDENPADPTARYMLRYIDAAGNVKEYQFGVDANDTAVEAIDATVDAENGE